MLIVMPGKKPGAALLELRRAWAIGQLRERYLLTERETDVVDIFARGRSVESIGRQLGVSENTVKTHLRNVYRKTSVHSREELLNLIEEVMEEDARR